MDYGTTIPITEFGGDLGAIREFVQAADDMGYAHIRMLDHVLGANPEYHPEVPQFYYTHESYIHEPFTLMGYLAAITKNVQFVTGILILPQRQTALVAKQAAEVDVLSGGRLKLGIGVGWNPVEYEALGEDFTNRGRRCEEQMTVMRELWTKEVVNFEGRWHRITHAGISPLPVQRPIPIWIGAGAPASPIPPEASLRRIARSADGWFPLFPRDQAAKDAVARLHGYANEIGRDPATIGMEGSVRGAGRNPEDWLSDIKEWEELGATGVSVGTGGAGLTSADQHIDVLRQFKEAMMT
jgi:probable F420-dependent oxidoreductase